MAAAIALALPVGAAQAAGPGAVDASFGENGQVSAAPGGGGAALTGGLMPQDNGKLVAAGTWQVSPKGATMPGKTYAALARFTRGGELDKGYGTQGWTLDDRFETTGQPAPGPGGTVLLPGGRIEAFPNASAWVARFTADGARDRSFGDEGAVKVDVPAGFFWARYVAAGPDGKIYVAFQGQTDPNNQRMTIGVARLNADGSTDTSFGENGLAITDTGHAVQAAGPLVVLPDGGVAMAAGAGEYFSGNIAGINTYNTPGPVITLIRYRPDGRLDSGFGADGLVDTGVKGEATAATLAHGETIVVTGTDGYQPFPGRKASVTRWNIDGSPDADFGQNGKFAVMLGTGSDGNASTEDPDGRLVVAGSYIKPSTNALSGASAGWAVFRVKANGRLDRSFGDDGRVTTPTGPSYTKMSAVALQDDGRIVAGGTSSGCKGAVFTLVRLHGDTTGEGLRDPGPLMDTCPGEQPVENGTVALTIACPLVELTCTGDIVLDAPIGQYLENVPRNEKLRMGKARFDMRGNTTKKTRVKLSSKAKRFVTRQKRFKATATITAKDDHGKRRTVKRRVTVALK